ncbi:MAG: KilA-N domain-containing protein [Candidatus Competibacteraceae bacterium]|nr:KilA-N domain-containing protein [Candidatus Competibacteraceae bacterium]
MAASIIHLDYQGTPVTFNESGWFNATIAAAHYGKRPVDWLALDSTQEYIETLADFSNCEKSSLLKTRAGRHNGGTWLHPKLAVPFARWLDVRFAIWCDVQIEGLLKGRHPHLDWRRARSQATASFKVMNDVLQMVREESGKVTARHHFINEARLINGVLSGQFSALDRECLSESELSLLANLEVRNSVLIGRDLPYAERKLILKQYAVDLRPSALAVEAA